MLSRIANQLVSVIFVCTLSPPLFQVKYSYINHRSRQHCKLVSLFYPSSTSLNPIVIKERTHKKNSNTWSEDRLSCEIDSHREVLISISIHSIVKKSPLFSILPHK